MTKLQCPKCGRTWDYEGEKEREERVTCPLCWRKFRITQDNIV